MAAILALAGLLAGGIAGRRVDGSAVGPAPLPSLLPTADLSSSMASVWSCPGPLPVSGGASSVVSIANPGPHSADATVLTAETAYASPALGGHALGSRSEHVIVPPRSQLSVPVAAMPLPPSLAANEGSTAGQRRSGSGHRHESSHGVPPSYVVDAAVGVTVTGAGVVVSEAESSGGQRLGQPCAAGVSSRGYIAEGLTSGSYDEHVALFNPEATAAVVDVAVGTGGSAYSPAQLQGVVVPPKGLSIVDIARYVPQRARLAVAAVARVGRVAVGAVWGGSARFSTTVRGVAHRYTQSGPGLAVGVGRALASWSFPAGDVGPSETPAVRIFNPGGRVARVSIRAESGGRDATLQVTVPPGSVAVAAAPVAGLPTSTGPGQQHLSAQHRASPPHRTSSGKGASSGSPAAPVATNAVTLTVTSSKGTGVVVERETYHSMASASRVVVRYLQPVSGAWASFVLAGVAGSPADAAVALITNPGTTVATGTIRLLDSPGARATSGSSSASGTAGSISWTVPARSSVSIPLARFDMGKGGAIGLSVTSNAPVFASEASGATATRAPGVPLLSARSARP